MVDILVAGVFLIAVGLPPAWVVTTDWSVAVPLSGPVAGLVLSVAAVGCLLSGTALLPWVAGAVGVSWLAAAAALVHRRGAPAGVCVRGRADAGPTGTDGRRAATQPSPGGVGLAALGLTALVSLPVLAATVAAPTEADARAAWFFHARWLWSGGRAARAALANPAFAYTHPDYPPLVPATTAGLWSVVGGGNLRLAQALTTVQTWLAALLAAVVVMSVVSRRVSRPLGVAGGVFVLGCFGVAGGFATRGYADALWALTAAAGAVVALVHPPGRRAARLAAVCLAAAALTKSEGLVVVACLIVPLAALRWLAVRRRAALPLVGWLAGAVAVGVAWVPVAARFVTRSEEDITLSDVGGLLAGRSDKVDRLEPALHVLWGFGRTSMVGAALAIVAALVVWRQGRLDLRGGLWLPGLALGAFALFVVVLAAGRLDVVWWAQTGGFRTMIVVRCLLLVELLLLAGVALEAWWPSGPSPDRPENRGPAALQPPDRTARRAPGAAAPPARAGSLSGRTWPSDDPVRPPRP